VNKLKHIWLTISHRLGRLWFLPRNVADALDQKRRLQVVRNESESERLDRLRNPSKYLGK
jgi:hypothetical protein